MKSRLGSIIVSTACLVLGCGGSPSPKVVDRPDLANESKEGEEKDPLSVIATVPSGTLGPYIGYGPGGAQVLFAPHSEEGERRWYIQRLDAKGERLQEAREVAPAPDDVPFAVVRAVGDSYLNLWVRQVHRADVLEGVLVGKTGAVGVVSTVTQARGEVVWADAFTTPKGILVLWAEQAGDRATLYRVMLDEKGVPKGVGESFASDVRAWEAASLDDGVALGMVVVSDQDPLMGSVVLQLLDEEGAPRGQAVPVSRGGSARQDVGLVRTRRSLLLAWTDRSEMDSLVYAATADLKGRLMVSPRAPLPALGDQALVDLIEPSRSNPDQALLVYEHLPAPAQGPRELRLVNLSSEAMASQQTVRLSFEPVGLPTTDFGSTPDGFTLLTQVRACASEPTCEPTPWYIRLGSALSVDGAGPVLFRELGQHPPALVWSPGCTGTSCLALAVSGTDPAKVASFRLKKGTVVEGAPVEALEKPKPPHPKSNRTIHAAEEKLSAIDVGNVGNTTFLAYLTQHEEGLTPSRLPPPGAPGDTKKPMEALLGVQRIDASGQRIDAPTIVSIRARSTGGLALAPHLGDNEVAVAWTARDNGVPQVFVTRVGSDGKTRLQRMITRSRGEVGDVAIAAHGDGWILGWVDWRDGNGEVYVARLDKMLIKQGVEKRITQAEGDAADLSLLVMGNEVIVAYGDMRDHPNHATANPYVQKLNATTLARIGEEHRIDSSEHHTQGIHLSKSGQDVVLGWLTQSAPTSGEMARGGAWISRLDPATLQSIGSKINLDTQKSQPISMKLSCEVDACHGAMMVSASGHRRIEGFQFHLNTSRAEHGQLARCNSLAPADITPALLNGTVFFVDRGTSSTDSVRRVEVQWSP